MSNFQMTREIDDFVIVETGNKYGTMNVASNFYPMRMKKGKRELDQLKRRIKLGKDLGFNGKRMYSALQFRKDGSYLVIDKEFSNNESNGWLKEIKEDILMIDQSNPKVVIGHTASDEVVVIMMDKKNKACAVSCCNGEMIDLKMPIKVLEALEKEYKTDVEDVEVYISSCIDSSYDYDRWPNFIKDIEVWDRSICTRKIDDKTYYNVDFRKAVLEQLNGLGIFNDKIHINNDDTFSNSNYYSSMASKVNKKKLGRNFVGIYCKDKDI